MIKANVVIDEQTTNALKVYTAGAKAGLVGLTEADNPYFNNCHTVEQLLNCRLWLRGFRTGRDIAIRDGLVIFGNTPPYPSSARSRFMRSGKARERRVGD